MFALSSLPVSEQIQFKEYLLSPHPKAKTLVIGCGKTPEKANTALNIPGIPCSLGRDHLDDFTIDISPYASPNLVMDFVNWKGTDLHLYGLGRLDSIEFEYINRGPRNPFQEEHIRLWLEGADALLKPMGVINYYSGEDRHINIAMNFFKERRYQVDKVIIPRANVVGNMYGHKFCQAKKHM
uniref:hypothetical protein n=1 Tax=Serratia quinivorans TaxID=137545 RepID=UPI0035C74519